MEITYDNLVKWFDAYFEAFNRNAGPFKDDFRQTVLVRQFHLYPCFLKPGIVRMGFERFKMFKIGQPAFADLLID